MRNVGQNDTQFIGWDVENVGTTHGFIFGKY